MTSFWIGGAPATRKVALVTGAGSGIGRACAERFAAMGMAVAALDASTGPRPDASDLWWGEPTDVADAAAVARFVEQATAALGPIEVLVNAAGISGPTAPTGEMSEDGFDRVIAVNLKGAFLTTKYVLRGMTARGRGSIVHIASVAGMEGSPAKMPYSASKGGLIAATRAMAWEYGRHGVRVNCICPGLIETAMTDEVFAAPDRLRHMTDWAALRRTGAPAEIAAAAAFLAFDEASFITGHALVVDGGWTAGRAIWE